MYVKYCFKETEPNIYLKDKNLVLLGASQNNTVLVFHHAPSGDCVLKMCRKFAKI